ncbi:MAG: trypsin-like peptidase domain-containing protein [Planctomycetes bacterium]|nr:trypsin-like peptidase domain-containing protein [Planctomycetota bacterium]
MINRQQRFRIEEESQIQSLRRQLDDANAELSDLKNLKARAPEQAEKLHALEATLAKMGTRLTDFDVRVDSSIKQLSQLHETTSKLEDRSREGAVREATQEAKRAVEAVQADVKTKIETVEGRFRDDIKRLEQIQQTPRNERDIDSMAQSMLAPIVQLNGEDTVGSGVLIYSQKDGNNKTVTLVLSSYHVVRNILAETGDANKDKGIRLNLYVDGTTAQEVADMVAHDEDRDLVLLKMRGERICKSVARLFRPENAPAISVFSPIYAVGCPLGNDPIPTGGEIASLKNSVNNRNYWMINAPTYFGNSGGGVFLAKSHELIGIFSKIYTHGTGRPTVIPHMGLVTPIDSVGEFLEKNGYGFAVKAPSAPAAETSNNKESGAAVSKK